MRQGAYDSRKRIGCKIIVEGMRLHLVLKCKLANELVLSLVPRAR